MTAGNQRPLLVMPIGTTSYLVRSIASSTLRALINETSCSPLPAAEDDANSELAGRLSSAERAALV